ncbi:hypothetical protein ACWDV4_10875 [Micromonospora sp. NPDC003197]
MRERVAAMQRARRLVAVVTVAALGVIGLGACARSAPTVAAYVGDTKYSMDRVDAIYTDADQQFQTAVREQFAQRGETPPARIEPPISRQNVVDLLVSLELGKQVVAEKHIRVTDDTNTETAARVLRLPAGSEYVRLWAEWIDIFIGLQEQLPAAQLTDDAIMDVYRALVKAEAIDPGLSVAQVRQAFGDAEFVAGAIATRDALAQRANTTDTTMNPRFSPVNVPAFLTLRNGTVSYALPYVDSAAPVTDLADQS